MQLNKNYLAVALIFAGVCGAGLFAYFRPPTIKTVTVEHETVRTDVHTVTRTIERPDGTRETITDTTDKSKSDLSRKNTVSIPVAKNWLIGGGASVNYKLEPAYHAVINRRILGPVYAGAIADTTGRVGLSVLMEF